MKGIIVEARKWNEADPKIKVKVFNDPKDSVGIEMTMEEFHRAYCIEFGSPATTLTKSSFAKKSFQAMKRVLSGAKKETDRVVNNGK